MFLSGIGTAVPKLSFTQPECWKALQDSGQFQRLTSRAQAVLRKVLLGDNGIGTRHLAFTDLSEAFVLTPDAMHARFKEHAAVIASEAGARALAAARLAPAQIDAVIISTCTGYLCPGLTSYVSERLGLRPDVLTLDLVGQGCGAAVPNFRTADALLGSARSRHVLSICVEICSAAFYLDNDPGVLISACLFGDGAGAVVWSAESQQHARLVEWKHARSDLQPAERSLLCFEQSGGMLRNILDRQVPGLAARHAQQLLDSMLEQYPLRKSDIKGWILHAGGREVLSAVRDALVLNDDDLELSTQVLANLGNVSSPFVIFVLEQALAKGRPGGWWWLSTFGAGFSCHGAFLKVD